MWKQPTVVALMLLTLAGCSARMDMQGVDPRDYYAAHPIKNKVEMKTESFLVHFSSGNSRLSGDEISDLRSQMHHISPQSAENVQLEYAEADHYNATRERHLAKLLRSMGYGRDVMVAESSPSLPRGSMQVSVTYAQIVLPDCPDWRTSPVTTYSNTHQGNIGCSTEVNRGLMVADPRDLLRGSGDLTPDTQRAAKVVEDYRSGIDPSAAGAASGSASGGSSGSSTGVSAASGH